MSLDGGYIRSDIAPEKTVKRGQAPVRQSKLSEVELVPVEQDGLLFLVFFIKLTGFQKGHER